MYTVRLETDTARKITSMGGSGTASMILTPPHPLLGYSVLTLCIVSSSEELCDIFSPLSDSILLGFLVKISSLTIISDNSSMLSY